MNNKDKSISLLRVLGMILIILCHLCSWLGINAIAQLFNVGVYLFLFISGYLYSSKSITSTFKWLTQRWKKLCIPVLVWVFFVIGYGIIVTGTYPSLFKFLVFLFNLQGIPWIILNLSSIGSNDVLFSGLGHLWFVTVIFLCYLILVIVKKSEKRIESYKLFIWIIAFCAFILFAFFNINIIYFLTFFVGYHFGKNKKNYTTKQTIIATVLALLIISLRLLFKRIYDNTILYDVIVVGISQTILSIWIFIFVQFIITKISFIKRVSGSRMISLLDNYSFHVYITHYFFLSTVFGLNEVPIPQIVKVIIFVVMSAASAILLKTVIDFPRYLKNRKLV